MLIKPATLTLQVFCFYEVLSIFPRNIILNFTLIILLIFGFIASLLVAFFQYYYKEKSTSKITFLLFILRFLGLFLLIVLLINPTIHKKKIENNKPSLSILIDNSQSIAYFNETNRVKEIVSQLVTNKELTKKFNISQFTFGSTLALKDSIDFSEKQTQISEAFTTLHELQKDKISPVIFLSDGNQTVGSDYAFYKSKQPIYPVVIGDTTSYVDVSISQINSNKYSFINNQFPVEILLNYEGTKKIATQLTIYKKNKLLFKKTVNFSPAQKSKIVNTKLRSTQEGLHYYTATIAKIADEKNTQNNTKTFSVEVINQQTKILLLSSILHPDLGAFKRAIESNKHRAVDVVLLDDFKNKISDYQLIILYQPTAKFASILSKIQENNTHFFLVSGSQTNWDVINQFDLGFQKNAINQTENYTANFNPNFLPFLQEDLGFNNFSPLQDRFGQVYLSKEHQVLLFQNINGIVTNQPLLATFDINNQKAAVLFGEGLWAWRAASFLNTNSFKDFDTFLGNLIQFLASNKKRSRLEINAETLYPANSTIQIAAFYTDKNYQFDARALLEISIKNGATNELIKIPFSLVNNSFQVGVENLQPGEYDYTVAVLNQKISKSGSFKITTFNVEEQFTKANVSKLQLLATQSKGKLFYRNQIAELLQELTTNKAFYTTQKSTIKLQDSIDFKWILFLIIGCFSAEWFIRKYHGKI